MQKDAKLISNNLDLNIKCAEKYSSLSFDYNKMLTMYKFDPDNLLALSEKTVKILHGKDEYNLPRWLWSSSSIDSLKIPIGLGNNNEVVEFEIGIASESNMLVTGKQGSGKSNFLDVIIITSCLKYSPDELELYLIDLKDDGEFDCYSRLPHVKKVAITSESREYAVFVLKQLKDELGRRAELCYTAITNEVNMKNYRLKTKQNMPRILVIVDEYQNLFDNNDSLSLEANHYIEDLVKIGRSFGINLILTTQNIRSNDLIPNSIKNYFTICASFITDENNVLEITRIKNIEASRITPTESAIYNQKAGELTYNQSVKIASLKKTQVINLTNRIRKLANDRNFFCTPIVYDDQDLDNQ